MRKRKELKMFNENEKILILDTETTNSIEEPIAYDIGWAIIDLKTEEVLKTESYAIAEIFLDKELMSCAFFVDKIPSYWEEIKNGSRKLARLSTIRKTLVNDCKVYGVKEIYAHNAIFDNRSCNLTQRYITGSKYRYFFPYGITIKDSLKYSKAVLKDSKEYNNFCNANEYRTKNNQNRYTAEIIYRFLTNNIAFNEEHKGIDDVMIEKEIVLYCKKHLPNFDTRLW